MADLTVVGFLPLNKSGDTMTGTLTLNSDPANPLEAATKQYVDGSAGGFDFKESCVVATTANLNATYANGSSGVGATLTNAGAQAALSIDGVSLSANDRVLVKDQTSQDENGIYKVTTVGDASTNWVLTRTEDYDEAAEITPGNFVVIEDGTVNSLTSWLQTNDVTTIGTDNIVFSKFSETPSNFADRDLSNLTSPTAINQTLLPDTDNNYDFGSASAQWANTYAVNCFVGTAIIHTGDANNKIAFGTDTQDFQTGGSSRMDLSDSGMRLGGANIRVDKILDEDDMVSDSAVALSTQQAIKKYVDDNSGGGGKVLTASVASTSTPVSTSSTIPIDNTVPQNTEGAELITVTITPTKSTSKLVIFFQGFFGTGGITNYCLFQDSASNALRASSTYSDGSSGADLANGSLMHEMTSGTTSSTTFKIRFGSVAVSTAYALSEVGSNVWGSASLASLVVYELDI